MQLEKNACHVFGISLAQSNALNGYEHAETPRPARHLAGDLQRISAQFDANFWNVLGVGWE